MKSLITFFTALLLAASFSQEKEKEPAVYEFFEVDRHLHLFQAKEIPSMDEVELSQQARREEIPLFLFLKGQKIGEFEVDLNRFYQQAASRNGDPVPFFGKTKAYFAHSKKTGLSFLVAYEMDEEAPINLQGKRYSLSPVVFLELEKGISLFTANPIFATDEDENLIQILRQIYQTQPPQNKPKEASVFQLD